MTCQGCGSTALESLVDFGRQPVTNRFLHARDAAEERFPLRLGQCRACGLLQLLDFAASDALVPRLDWITYREPEEHVPRMAAWIRDSLSLTAGTRLCAFSPKDDSTVTALSELGVGETAGDVWRLASEPELAGAAPVAAVETLTDRLRPELARRLAAARGGADLIVIRQLMEHAADLPSLLAGLRCLLRPDGAVAVEVPDCTRWLDGFDYTGIWEEHRLYFTPATALGSFRRAGWCCRDQQRFSYPYEDSLVFLLTPSPAAEPPDLSGPAVGEEDGELARGRAFSDAFAGTSARYRSALTTFRQRHGCGIALFGAGHLACAFVNYHGLEDLIDCVIDDNPHKAGCFLPGARLPVTGSAGLADSGVRLCLTCFAPENEDRVIARHGAFINAGGRFRSIFPGSTRYLLAPDGGPDASGRLS